MNDPVEVSDMAFKLWRLLNERWRGTLNIEEVKRELRTSKAGVMRALAELEDARLIRTDIEEG